MTVLIDMDDVLEKLVEGWLLYNNKRFGTTVVEDDIREWDISKAFPGISKELVYEAELDDALWDLVRPVPGAVEYVKKIIDDGHEVYIVSATYYQTLKAKMEKVLFKYFPYISWSKVIICTNKQMIKGDVLIDDGPHNFIGGEYRKLLFTAAHNREFDEKIIGATRVNSWEEAYEEIKKLSKELDPLNFNKIENIQGLEKYIVTNRDEGIGKDE